MPLNLRVLLNLCNCRMSYNLIPLILMLVSGAVILRIVIRKFPAIVNLDVESLPQEKERQVKQQLIANRFRRNMKRWLMNARRIVAPVLDGVSRWVRTQYATLLSKREQMSQGEGGEDVASEIDALLLQAEDARRREDYSAAEKIYVRIISLDSKHIRAFKELGYMYLEEQKFDEARQTLEHVLKLTKEDAEVYEQLGEATKKKGDLEEAKKYYQEAVKLSSETGQNHFNIADTLQQMGRYKEALSHIHEALAIEPKSPRYLDAFFNLAILLKDKAEALEAYKRLKSINPENGKLGDMKKMIDEL